MTTAVLSIVGILADGTKVDGRWPCVKIVRQPAVRVYMTEKLLIYALGRGLEHYDMRSFGHCPRRGEAGLQVFGADLHIVKMRRSVTKAQ